MKSLIISLLLFYTSVNAYSQKTDVEDDKLKGKVKSVSFISYSQDPGEERRFGIKSFTSYNEKGFMLEHSYFDKENGLKDNIIIPTYDGRGVKILDSSFTTGRVYDGKSTYTFDKLGNRIEWLEYNSRDSLIMRHSFKYNSKKQLVKHLRYNPVDLVGSVEYILDAKGRVLSDISSGGDGTFNYQFSYVYDIKGNTISEQFKHPDKTREYLLKMQYDKFGNVISEEKYNVNGVVEEKRTISYEYDKYNNWIFKSAISIHYYDKGSYETYETEYREIVYY